MGLEPKKLAILRILQILEEYSDYEHPLTQADIACLLERDYDIRLERKAISNNLALLRYEAGFDIVSDRQGSYLTGRKFEDSELKLLIDSVLYSKYIAPKYAKDLIEKLASFGSMDFRKNLKTSYIIDSFHDKTFTQFFSTIDLLEEAIQRGVQVKFILKRYGTDKNLHPVWDDKVTVNPYRIIAHKGSYYLVGSYDADVALVNFGIEYIFDTELTEVPRQNISETEKGELTVTEYIDAHPKMYAGNIVSVKMRVGKVMIGDIITSFGKNFTVHEIKDEHLSEFYVDVTFRGNFNDVLDFALENADYCTVLSPQRLVDKIKNRISGAYKTYIRLQQ